MSLVAVATYLLLPAVLQDWVFVYMELMTGHAGEVVDHVKCVLPVLGGVAFVAFQAAVVMFSHAGAPAWPKADARRSDSRPRHVFFAGAVTALAVIHNTAMGTFQHIVYGRVWPEVMTIQAAAFFRNAGSR